MEKKQLEENIQGDFDQQMIMSGILALLDRGHSIHEVLTVIRKIAEVVWVAYRQERRIH